MTIGNTLYVTNRTDWRKWLQKHHKNETEIWLIYYKKSSGKPRIAYNEAVEEALCFGWIDSIEKGIDHERFAQRFTPRKPKSNLSPLNAERIRKLIREKKMTSAGIQAVEPLLKDHDPSSFSLAPDVKKALKKDQTVWENFQAFPPSYKRIRIGWIEGARKRPVEFQKRLNYFITMTAQNKTFGMGGTY